VGRKAVEVVWWVMKMEAKSKLKLAVENLRKVVKKAEELKEEKK